MLLYDMIEELRQQSPAMLPSDYDAVLFKALIVHSAQWTNAWGLYQQILKNGQNSKRFREYVGRFLGACPRIRSWRRNPPRNNLLTAIWTLSWSN